MTGRIIKGIGGIYSVAAGSDIYECSARGKFRKNGIIPTVGDFVEISVLDEKNKKGSVDEIKKRKNMLVRPRAANIDLAVITFAITKPEINNEQLDRFLILAQQQKIENVVICINKCDLAGNDDTRERLEKIYSPIYKMLFVSAEKGFGIEELRAELKGKVSVFAGPSGVGKSSLINAAAPNMNLATGEISRKIERGKHTTRKVELIEVDEDTFIMDSPGFTSLSLEYIKAEELVYYFREFEP
ncbi:MAG: ribosome small subunit-dependent GTPase A, partial [Firmicutes bacterium]|nr:ribosome small subunit-dependent GTPase A [Bacillota bacterium]